MEENVGENTEDAEKKKSEVDLETFTAPVPVIGGMTDLLSLPMLL